ncbi:UDP-N-Acetylglucosamine 2-epimerase [Alkalithermobacter thermoalcaliphilus JW-YL-7 = DSM 7308]|uniref:UDP-N-acetylglucosamine 2-epimerase (non-hydrolyzing) n=1 Tax=Alkalithermobacter thermoalcaliphilus JW-YL-7 = DSM 7308 TaxID=1121328 RepID=A0A150FSC5_CLOPD|nr:UDP-N-acetylglucosamine 2-epimerase [[Clostridium] paradoxum JW-YL-7 = DSM 7308]SHK71692.1 UDP-N-Acetylglucosamine 2-epimerase [[Clostridium] paradoxum JW-YL-7 = DSM 7308]
MNKIRVMTIFGTRPEAIKMAPLVKEFEKRQEFESIVCVTAQHRQMLDTVLDLFDITPKYDLNIMKHGQSITDITNKVLKGVEDILKTENVDIVLVHGDTTTTFAGALAAFYNKIPIGHVEAGLRSDNMYSPYPEEMNRRLTSKLATLHFAPTNGNKENLLRENVEEKNIFVTGNTVIDALLSVVKNDYKFSNELDNIDFENKKVVLLTCHRRENWGRPMENIFKAVKRLAISNKDIQVIFPMHMNPVIREVATNILKDLENVNLIEPLDYEPFANLINKSYLILTDSGGIQEEAPGLGKPVVVLRTETERPEAVKAKTVKIAGIEEDNIFQIANELINDKKEYEKMARAINPYGDGKSSKRIADHILQFFQK